MDLTQLADLPGAPDTNFEALTRAIVSRRYGALGTIRERRQQPGVEFYLRVEHPGEELGDPGRVWGWSCKWFMLGSGNRLTHSQRTQIEESVDKAIEYVDGLTDFVLCLPQRPAKKDEEWIDGLGPSRDISTKLWAAENFDAQLSGFDELRSTFFGELVLSPEVLEKAHERSVAPVKARWMPQLHRPSHVEHKLERALLRSASFGLLDERAASIARRAETLRDAVGDIDEDSLRADAKDTADDLDKFVTDLRAIVNAGRNCRPTEASNRIAEQQPPASSPRKLRDLVFALRRRRLPAALAVTGIAAEIRDAVWWLQEADADAHARMIAVVAAAGLGKTHLAAQLTAPLDQETAGVFIQGGHLRAGDSLDELAQRIPGLKVNRFDDLLQALNSAGARAGARIPVAIDGLNEAERPSEWRGLLEELVPALGDFPNVVVVITLREKLATSAVPATATTVELKWHRPEVNDLVKAYFEHYLINPAGARLPTRIFHNPLFVRIYCEAANPQRQHPVGVEGLPTSLVGVFELYLERVVKRLAEDPARVAIPSDQIKRRLTSLALELWTRGTRRLPFDEARATLDAGETNWDESLFRRLQEEDVLLREEIDGGDDTQVGILFDRFAGYLIADGLLMGMPDSEVAERLSESSLWESLLGEENRPFGDDVAVNIVGLVPRRFGGHHLWRFAPDERRPWALAQELDSESEFLDDQTVHELERLIVGWAWPSSGRRHPFDRLWEVRASPTHRLNADFLDRVLRRLPLPERDSRWTEWVRLRTSDLVLEDLKALIDHWAREPDRNDQDGLNALATAWLLTSTSEQVRDLATKALQRYGRPEPKRVFVIASRMLDVDDPYVIERAVGAAFGATCAHQMPDPGGPFERALADWLVTLRDRFLDGGTSPTTHELLRSYVRATFEFAGTLHAGAVPAGVDPATLTFEATPLPPIMADDDPNAEECGRTLRMDFENYVIGSAIEGRRNYDFQHAEFRRARGEVMARVWDLGWRAALLGDVDRSIADAAYRFGREGKVERYGKKYGWIAYYELIGHLVDAGRMRDRWVGGGRNITPDIDPSFPDEPPVVPIPLPEWAPTGSPNDEVWLRTCAVDVPEDVWSPDELHNVAGGWLLVEGFLEHKREGRSVWAFFRTLLLEPDDLDPALTMIDERDYLGNDFLPKLPSAHGVFAGEAPWSPRFQVSFDDDDTYSAPALRHDWQDEGISLRQVAVELPTGEAGTATALAQSYDVPSFEFAAQFGLRQQPGTLDLVDSDGRRASATFRTEEPWRGHLLYIRRDLAADFAGDHRIVQVGWGEREVTVDWNSVPTWIHDAQQSGENAWRNRRAIDMP